MPLLALDIAQNVLVETPPVCEKHGIEKKRRPRDRDGRLNGWRCHKCDCDYANEWARKNQGSVPRGSPEHIAKISGPNSHKWIGDDACYDAVHGWLLKWFPKTGTCETCGRDVGTARGSGTTYAYIGDDPRGYERDRSKYREWCYPCHLGHDRWVANLRFLGIEVVREF